MTRIVALAIDIIMVVCSVLSVNLNGDVVQKYRSYEDVSYGRNERHELDLYLPVTKKDEVGLILFIHGGSWSHGSKDSFRKRCRKFVKQGYAAATVNYRLITQGASAHDMLDDISSALGKIKKIAAKRKINIKKVMTVGISAGGHLSLLYSYTRCSSSPVKPVAAVAYCPPSDLYDSKMYTDSRLGSKKKMAAAFSVLCDEAFTYKTKSGAKKELKAVSPYHNISKNTVPTLIAHGKKDTAVPYSQSSRLIRKLKDYGVPCNLVTFPNSGHHLDNDPKYREKFNDYIKEYAFVYLKNNIRQGEYK